MSNVKVSALPSGGTLLDTDAIPVVRAGVTDQVNTGTLVADVSTAKTDITSLKSSRTTDEADITSLKASRTTDEAAITALQNAAGPTRTPLDQSTWGWINQGSAAVNQGGNVVQLVLGTEGSENVRGRFTAAPATPYTITALIYPGPMNTSGTCGVGPAFRETGSGKIVYIAYVGNASGAGPKWHVHRNSSPTVNSSVVSENVFSIPSSPQWVRISDNGTLTVYSYSFDGVNFFTLVSETRGSFFTTAPDQVGIIIQNFGAGITVAGSVISWVIS